MDIVKMLRLSIDSIHPSNYKKVFSEQEGKGGLKEAVTLITVSMLIYIIVLGTVLAIRVLTTSAVGKPISKLNIITSLVIVTLGLAAGIVIFVVNQYLLKIISNLLGGKGRFDDQAYLSGLIASGGILVVSVLSAISLIPYLGIAIYLLGEFILVLWIVYMNYKMIRKVYGLTMWRTIGVLVIDGITLFVIMIILGFIFMLLEILLGTY